MQTRYLTRPWQHLMIRLGHVLRVLPVASVLFLPGVAQAGFCISDVLPGDFHHEFSFFAGYSPESPTLIGTTTDRRFAVAGFDYSYRCWSWKHLSISFSAGLMPAAILLQPREVLPSFSNDGLYETVPGHAVYGFGVTPIGFTIDFARDRRVYPFMQIDGGVIASTQPIPVDVPGATGLNFLFDFGGGIKWRLTSGRHLLSIGYKFLHISNAFTTPVNPGVDNNVFYVGFSLLR